MFVSLFPTVGPRGSPQRVAKRKRTLPQAARAQSPPSTGGDEAPFKASVSLMVNKCPPSQEGVWETRSKCEKQLLAGLGTAGLGAYQNERHGGFSAKLAVLRRGPNAWLRR